MAFSRNGALASAHRGQDHCCGGRIDGVVRLWDVATRQPVGDPLQRPHGPVLIVAFSRDGTRIAAGDYDKTIRLWDAAPASARRPDRTPVSGDGR